MSSTTWGGQYGTILLGPTEDRVARFLADATKHGLVTLRTTAIADRLALTRSEAYRILRVLRTLGLFGIEDDRSGARGGRRIWRTPGRRPGITPLHPGRHRAAWARIAAWAKARAGRIIAAVRALTSGRARPKPSTLPLFVDPVESAPAEPASTGADPPRSPFATAVRRWAPELADKWDREPGARPDRWRARP